jgi:hypothetical protein
MSIYEAEQLLKKYRDLPVEEQEKLSDFLDKQIRQLEIKNIKHNKNLEFRATGKLVFEFDQKKPMHHFHVELWDRDVITPDDFLGSGLTDQNGDFEIWYDPADAGKNDLPDLELRVYETEHSFDEDGKVVEKNKLIHSVKGGDDVTEVLYEFGTIKIPYWEYASETPSPRVHVPEYGEPPQAYSNGRILAMMTSVAPLEVVKRKHFMINKLNKNKPGLEEIQKAYPKSKTMFMEEENPGSSRSDEYFGDRFLNGMVAANLDRDPRDPNFYWLYMQWNAYEQDGIHCLPNVDIRFKVEDEKLLPVKITFAMREEGVTEANAPTTKVEVDNTEGERWQQAKRIARVAASLWAELEAHLINTHLNTEQYAIAFYRNIRKNPVKYLLGAHVKEVASINHGANTMLIGEEGFITQACALTSDSINVRISQAMGMLDWKNWKPRDPICQTHNYAHCAGVFWESLHEYVDTFFEENLDEIVNQWFEIRCFSDDVVNHANPLYLCSYLSRTLEKDDSWFSKNERPDLHVPRRQVNGQISAVSPITNVDANPSVDDINNLKQVCRYIIMHSTFMHSWANDRQHDDGGEVLYSSLGLRYGKNGVFAPESDMSIAPSPRHASEQLWFATFLSRTKFGFIMKNEDRDIPPLFLEVLRKYKPRMDELGFDIDGLQSRTNI